MARRHHLGVGLDDPYGLRRCANVRRDHGTAAAAKEGRTIRVIVTGSREFTDQKIVYDVLDGVHTNWQDYRAISADHPFFAEFVLLHGTALGADTLADNWARDRNRHGATITIERHPANWKALGHRAGLLRNEEMVDTGVDLVVAFFQVRAANKGTAHCVQYALNEGIEVREHWNAPYTVDLPLPGGTL